VDIVRGKIVPGDLFLLCSDGLHGMVGDGAIAEVLASADTLPAKADRLVGLAKDSGGDDNITVALCEVGTGAG
jgi:protein phosphatase